MDGDVAEQTTPESGATAQDELLLRNIVASTTDGLVVLNRDGVIQFVNPAAENLFNRTASALIGSVFGFPLVGDEPSEIDLVQASGDVVTAQLRVVEIEWSGQPGLLVALRDITEYKRTTEVLRQSDAFNQAVLNSLTSHIAVINEEGVIVAINRAWEQFAASNGDPKLVSSGLGVNYFDVCRRAAASGDTEAARALAGMLAVLKGHRPLFEQDYPCHSPDQQRWFTMRVTPFMENGRPWLVVAHVDVTEERRSLVMQAEAELIASTVLDRQRELDSLETFAEKQVAETSLPPLRERMPDRFDELVVFWEKLLDKAIEQRTYDVEHAISNDLRTLAEYIGFLKVGPRDVMDIYLAALKNRISGRSTPKAQVYLEEGRVMVLELMGYLVGFYRSYLPTVMRTPAS